MKKRSRRIHKCGKADWDAMKQDTTHFVNQALTADKEDTVNVMMQKRVPSSWTRTSNMLPWITPKLRRLCKKEMAVV
jgi:hypothetical protein